MNKKLLFGILLLIFGLSIVIATLILEQDSTNSFRTGMFVGFGSGILGVAIVYIIKLIQYKKSPAKLKKDAMLSKEERNVMIKNKASGISVVIYNITFAVIIMTFAIINIKMETILIVFAGMMINIFVFFGMIYYYSKKY